MRQEMVELKKTGWKERWLKARLRALALCNLCGTRFLAASPHDRFCADCKAHDQRSAIWLPRISSPF